MAIVYGETGGGVRPGARGLSDRYAERRERFFFKVDGDGDGFFVPLAEQPYFRVQATTPYRYVLLGPSRAVQGNAFELRLSVVDRGNNLVESFVGDGVIASSGGDVELPERVKMGPSDRGSRAVVVVPKSAGLFQFAASSASNGT